MYFFKQLFPTIIFILCLSGIKSFIVLYFDTLFIKDKTIEEIDYFSNLTQTELYVNLTIGSKKESIKFILKMEKHGFIIYEKAYGYKNSSSYETFDKDINIRWIPSSMLFPSRDKFYLPYYDSYKDFKNNNKNYNKNNTNKTEFLLVEEINKKNPNYLNEMFYNYGIIGFQLISNPFYKGLEFIKSLKNSNEINLETFHLYFENITKNGFTTNYNKGYFLIGEELTDNENNKNKIEYIKCLEVKTYSQLIWGISFNHIYFKYNENDDIKEIYDITNEAEFIINFPFIKGVNEYFRFINKNFFDELLEKNICKIIYFIKHDIYTKENSYGYACDSNSKFFIEKLNNNFPELIFYNNDLKRNFTLTKNDLFSFNIKDEIDTNLYFLIVSGIDDQNRWILGIPFLKRYIFSFDYDKKRIGYYINYNKEKENINDENDKENNLFLNKFFKVVIIIISIIIIFVLGMIFNNIFKKPKKKRANELDDEFEYNTYEGINDNIDRHNKIIN